MVMFGGDAVVMSSIESLGFGFVTVKGNESDDFVVTYSGDFVNCSVVCG